MFIITSCISFKVGVFVHSILQQRSPGESDQVPESKQTHSVT